MTLELWAQLTGLLAFALNISSMFLKPEHDRLFRFATMATAASWVLHFHLIGAESASALAFLALIRIIFSVPLLRLRRHWKISAFLAFSSAALVAAALTWQGLTTLLALFAVLNANYAYLFLIGRGVRLQLLWGHAAWVAHNLIFLSAGGLLADSLAIVITLWRLQLLPFQSKTPPARLPQDRGILASR